MIKPHEIENKDFPKSVNGYKKKAVDEFLEALTVDMLELIDNNRELAKENSQLKKDISKYKEMEDILKESLVSAQQTSKEIINSAKKEAELIKQQADAEAAKLINETEYKIERIKNSFEDSKKDLSIFKTRFKSFLLAQLEMLEKLEENIT